MPPALQAKFAGLPRWAWLAIIAGGLTIGLILRARDDGEVPEEELVEEVIEDDTYMEEDTGYLGSGEYEFEDDDGRVAYPPANDPNIEINIGGGGGTGDPGGKSCKDKKPTDEPPKGYAWACRTGKWVLTPKKRSGSGGGGGNDGGPGGGGGGGGGGKGGGKGGGASRDSNIPIKLPVGTNTGSNGKGRPQPNIHPPLKLPVGATGSRGGSDKRSNGDGGGKNNGGNLNVHPSRKSIPQVTGGGPPSRRATHTVADGVKRRDNAKKILMPPAYLQTVRPEPVSTTGKTRVRGMDKKSGNRSPNKKSNDKRGKAVRV